MGEKWRVYLCKRRWGREGGQNTVRKKSDVPTQHDGPLRLKTLPLQQDGEGREREKVRGDGGSSSLLEPGTHDDNLLILRLLLSSSFSFVK